MAYNGSGIFNRLYRWVNDAAGGLFISATKFDAEMDGMATGLSNCMTRDGQSPPTADIPMGGHKLTGLANGTAAGDAVTVGQVNLAAKTAVMAACTANYSFGSSLTKVPYSSESIDALNEFDIANNRFTAATAGTFQIIAWLSLTIGADMELDLYLYKNGASLANIGSKIGKITPGNAAEVRGSYMVTLIAGDYLEVFFAGTAGTKLSKATDPGTLQVTRVV